MLRRTRFPEVLLGFRVHHLLLPVPVHSFLPKPSAAFDAAAGFPASNSDSARRISSWDFISL